MRVACIALLGLLCTSTAPLAAQDSAAELGRQEEQRRIQEAASLEWRGETDRAEAVLTGLLERKPTSSGGLFNLERILRSRSRIALVLRWVDRYLEADPDASGVRYMKLRVLVEIDSLAALEETADAWFAREVGSADPYREVARLYARAFDDRRALSVLQRGRQALRDAPPEAALVAMETGDLLARLGDGAEAVAAWSEAVRALPEDRTLTFPRLDRIAGEDPARIDPLLDALVREPASPEMRRTAVRLALSLGRPGRARSLTEAAMTSLDGDERSLLLDEVAERADEAGLPEIRLWALRTLRDRTPAREARSLDVRIASAALAAGDTATALEARARLARSLPAGSDERRRVIADLIRVEMETASARTLLDRLRGFEREFPEAVELDGLVAGVASALASRGASEEALLLLDDRTGPRVGLERAYLLLSEGAVGDGRDALDRSLPALAPSTATDVIQLLGLFESVTPETAIRLGEWAAEAHWGEAGSAGRAAAGAAGELPENDRAAVLAQAARWIESSGESEGAARLWARVVSSYAEAPEHPEAVYRLARLQALRVDGATEARALLQQLIVERPNDPIVPAARRELQRIGRGGS